MAKHLSNGKTHKKIFIVDDHPVYREGLATLIRREPGLTVCGEADNAGRALTAIERLKPDLVLVDIGLPGRSGLELVKDIRAVRRDLAVLVVSMHDESLYAERVLRAGGGGYIMKQEGPEKMLQAIRQVLNGEIYVSGRMAGRVLDMLGGRGLRNETAVGRLTDRELEILQLVGEGKDSHTIAKQLHLSFKTVDAHRGHIKDKLGLRNHTELISYAARWLESQAPARG